VLEREPGGRARLEEAVRVLADSLNVTVSGGAEWGGPQGFQFYVDGDGSACLFICLGVQGLVSSDALAACGTIDLLIVHLSAGFAVVWSGPDSGLHLFTGCDLQPYIPAGLQNIAGPSAIRARPRGSPARRSWSPRDAGATTQPVLGAGATAQLRLHRPHACLPASTATTPVPRHCIPSVVVVQAHSLASPADPGITPLVTLTGPPTDPRVFTTPTALGGYDFDTQPPSGSGATSGSEPASEGTALVDQSPVPVVDEVAHSTADCPTSAGTTTTTLPASCPQVTTTTIFVADPGQSRFRRPV
jgi:hypothetical protein